MNWHLLLAALLAALLPLALIATGVELRRVRLRTVEDLRDTVFVQHRDLPQILLALARYDRSRNDRARPSRQDEIKDRTGAFIYGLVCFPGFILLFDPITELIGLSGRHLSVSPAIFWSPDPTLSAAAVAITIKRSVAVAGFAFLGGYIFNLRYLIRQTLNQELSALAFVRAALRLVQGMILSIAVYHTGAVGLGSATDQQLAKDVGFAAALGIAFILGYFPDLGVGRIAQWVRVHVKEVDQTALDEARVIPLEVIDGIDHEVAFRLQESNLYDIQNLAVTNPIELYAETPYTLLQSFDWVLQAQLCLVVGVSSFHQLKRHRIRTIFDLERAVLSDGVPEDYLRALAAVLLFDASACFRKRIGLPEQCDGPNDTATASALVIRHIVAIISDDLHVHRLRILWQAIMQETRGGAADGKPLWLFYTGALPGDPPHPPAG
ncbi:hypothetical protein [Sphingomonas sp. VDB2]|uniref:hypothetical protein n=1 Tax=Sphingomonas sp. VDB2 TaxID=3228751 RepID=UPI003A80FB4E